MTLKRCKMSSTGLSTLLIISQGMVWVIVFVPDFFIPLPFYAILWFCEWFIEAFRCYECFIEEFCDFMPERWSRCLNFSLSLKKWLLTRRKLLYGERTMLSNNTVLSGIFVFFPRWRFLYGRAITLFFFLSCG